MPYTDFPSGIETLSAKEVKQLVAGGAITQLSNRNALPIVVASGDWSTQSGGPFDGWRYADLVHGRTSASIVTAESFKGADNYVHRMSGINDGQQIQNNTTLRVWIRDTVTYTIIFLVSYA